MDTRQAEIDADLQQMSIRSPKLKRGHSAPGSPIAVVEQVPRRESQPQFVSLGDEDRKVALQQLKQQKIDRLLQSPDPADRDMAQQIMMMESGKGASTESGSEKGKLAAKRPHISGPSNFKLVSFGGMSKTPVDNQAVPGHSPRVATAAKEELLKQLLHSKNPKDRDMAKMMIENFHKDAEIAELKRGDKNESGTEPFASRFAGHTKRFANVVQSAAAIQVGADAARRMPSPWDTIEIVEFKREVDFPSVLLSYCTNSTGTGRGADWYMQRHPPAPTVHVLMHRKQAGTCAAALP